MIAGELKVRLRIRVLFLFMIRMPGLFITVMREMPEMMYQYDRNYFFDSSKFMKRFGIKPTPYQEGIREMYKAHVTIDSKSAA